jgi:hypothetical protein
MMRQFQTLRIAAFCLSLFGAALLAACGPADDPDAENGGNPDNGTGIDGGSGDTDGGGASTDSGNSADAGPGVDGGPGPDAGPANDAGSNGDGGSSGTDGCTVGESQCTAHNTRRHCVAAGQGTTWQNETCTAGSGCFAGDCAAGQCADACNLGQTDGSRTCELYDLANDNWVSPNPGASMHDRSRAYREWLHRDILHYGGVNDAIYSDPGTWANVTFHGGMGDSAIWTGTYLAAEALRYMDTGSIEAFENIKDLVETLHRSFNVVGHPGVLARWTAPAGMSNDNTELDCDAPYHHCNVSYDGQLWDYQGHISRDQYQGVMLGYALAYEALGEAGESHRALIRDDVVEFVKELMKERTVTLDITWNGNHLGQFDVDVRHFVLNPEEMTDDGALVMVADSENQDDSVMTGFQEFQPNWGDMISQIPLLGLFTWIPRAGSAVMLSSFMRVAMLVTKNVPGFETDFADFMDYYLNNPEATGGNVQDWIGVADGWFYNDDCGGSYYANNIVMEPLFNWVRLEDDPALKNQILNDVVAARMWPEHEFTKNSWFFFMYGAFDPVAYASATTEGASQLAGFPAPPHLRPAVNLTLDPRYLPMEDGCQNQTNRGTAVDVSERIASDFIWQRHPWGLFDTGRPNIVYPGVDYLAAYWLGRSHGFIDDDAPGRCLAWRD